MNYVTLRQVRQYLRFDDLEETSDDDLLTRLIKEINGNIDEWCGRRFDVRQETRAFDYPVAPLEQFGIYAAEDFVTQMNQVAELRVHRRLRLDDDLLQLDTLTNGDGNTISSSNYVLAPANKYPKFAVQLKRETGIYWQLPTSGAREQVVTVAGLWGYHTRYGDRAWVDSLDTVQDNPLTAISNSLTVSNAAGLAGDGEAYRLQAGNMIRIDDEFLDVLAIDYGTNILTVARGYNGTTAASHAQGTTIDVYRPMENIVRAAARWVKYVYRQKDIDTMDTANILGTGVKISPSMMPPDVRGLLPSPRRGNTQDGLL